MAKDIEKQNADGKLPTKGSAWTGFWMKLKRLLPYMWPSNSPWLQLRVVFCIILLIAVRIINVFVPIYHKKIIDTLASDDRTERWPWQFVTIWIGLKLLQGGGIGAGLIGNLRTFLWIRVQQFTSLQIQVGLFGHIHDLSLGWHLQRKTGEVLRIMDRGTSSISSLLQYLFFSIVPTLIDIIIAIFYFCFTFNLWFGLILFIAMVLYLSFTVLITEWRTKFRREMNLMENDQRAKGVDSLLNAETVKYFSMESWETERYKQSITSYQEEEWKTNASLAILNIVQCFILNGAFLAISMFCAWLVWQEELSIGDFALMGTYFMQLMSPLNWIGTLYRVIQESFINMENMFDLMNEEVEVKDMPGSIPYEKKTKSPEIEFRDVNFFHDQSKPILQDVSFTIPGGTTTALVGSSGSGKTTMAKLVVRMFDVKSGKIVFDGHNIQSYTKSSLRGCIGVVPQDTVLFNDTIKYNIKYGKMEATDEEVENAAKLADIHESIMEFPQGYATVVGERGLKLSGGEKQRIAIARTLLKEPSVMIFDEATSSLDSTTERNIQTSIDRASRERTTLVVAHRLSTITRAYQILVLEQGKVVERGSHVELLEAGGKYAELWEHQSKEEEVK